MTENNVGSTSKNLAGKKALVTGGASGIGAACAKALAEAGAKVTVCDLNEEAAQKTADEIGGDTWVADLSDTTALEDIDLDIDILVNCAGVQHVAAVEDFPAEKWNLIQKLMLHAPFFLIRAALPKMYERGFGRIINISSAHGLRASAYKSAYVSAKHGLEGLSKVVALEGAEHGVTSNCVNPGYVRTPLVENQIADQAKTHGISEDKVIGDVLLKRQAIKELVEPGDVGALVTWLASGSARLVTGASYTIDGGWTCS